jgi:glutamyl-tRNA reductase
MNILIVGLNHKTAPLEVREKLAFDGDLLKEGMTALRQLPGVNEAALLSTCNRVEIYASVKDPSAAVEEILNFIASFRGIPRSGFEGSLYILNGEEAVRHLLRVASSLDSMVVGEPQILGQLKDSFDAALSVKATGFILNRLLKKAISTAKRVRTETRIAENAVSISYAAVELARKIFTGLAGKSVMLLGAGDMAELAARHLMRNGVQDIRIANRTFGRGCELAKEFSGRAVRFGDMQTELVSTDILICSTNAPSYVLLREQMLDIMKERRHRPVFLIDISVPRNIDPAINDIDNVYLYNIDDLQQVVDSNMMERKKEAGKAEDIVSEEVDKFSRWFSSLESVPVILALRQKAEDIRRDEVEKFKKSHPALDKEAVEAVDRLANTLVNKLMHGPTVVMKESDEERELMTYVIKKLYGLEENDED